MASPLKGIQKQSNIITRVEQRQKSNKLTRQDWCGMSVTLKPSSPILISKHRLYYATVDQADTRSSVSQHVKISSTVHVYKRNLAHVNYNISSTFTATKLSLGTNNNNMLNYKSAKNHGYLLNSTFFRNLFFTKMCIIRAVTPNIHTQQIIILVTFHVLTIIDLSRTSILMNENYS